ncbi:hypothetical protein BT96DRAFT_52643 [Gymnopus androsaceus JB14]|uniref:Uncharacterized protein n=1 Tax=Gymnopus androsaceus JB14 TaxID=1447944 RepID=A0A6A4I780_9AGAR|nr:hypothetical protein BT96DRAFT_52643 [Gymnopus androsaceus JB14]
MSSLYGFLGKQFPSPRSSYSFDFSHHDMPNDYWDDFGRSHRSVNEHAFPSSHPRSRLPSLNGLASSLTYAHRPNASTTQNSLRVVVDPHISYSPQTPVEASSIFSPETSPVWTGSSSSSTVASPASSIFPSRFVKEEEPESPKFIIEPLLPSSLVNKRLSSSSPAPVSPLTQAELESQLLLSQALAPPTEVPLRATQACTEMRQMMRSFRLNPFSILTSNGKDPKSDSGPVLTWCGEIAGPLEEPPQIFEWQLQGYSSGLEAELPKLIVMDDVDDFFNMAEEDGTSGLEAVSGEEIEIPDDLSLVATIRSCE